MKIVQMEVRGSHMMTTADRARHPGPSKSGKTIAVVSALDMRSHPVMNLTPL